MHIRACDFIFSSQNQQPISKKISFSVKYFGFYSFPLVSNWSLYFNCVKLFAVFSPMNTLQSNLLVEIG